MKYGSVNESNYRDVVTKAIDKNIGGKDLAKTNYKGKTYYQIWANDSMVDGSPYVYAISANTNDDKIYKLTLKWSDNPAMRDSLDASNWVDDWNNDVISAEAVTKDKDKTIDWINEVVSQWDL